MELTDRSTRSLMVTRFAEAGKTRSSPRDGISSGIQFWRVDQLGPLPPTQVSVCPLCRSLARTHDRRPDDRCREQPPGNPSQANEPTRTIQRVLTPVTAHGQHPADDVLGSNRAIRRAKIVPVQVEHRPPVDPTAAPPPRGEPSDAGRSGTAAHRPRRTHPRTRGRRSRPRRPESSGACSCRSREIERCSRAEGALASTRRRGPSPHGMRRDSSRL